ncbi:MAG: VCBS repeat-containing protein, partial [Candidatus Hydrogenedentes bacterium]|nr:VCBS repeat-containing protein [Candidatus Hydrogenedentota bacterium]
ESDFLPGDDVRYHVRRYQIERKGEGGWTARLVEEQQTAPMSASMRPCRLNDDDTIDFAGGDFQFKPESLLHAPVYDTLASTDGGHTTQFVRSTSFRPSCSFVDFDGDGRLDMVTECSGLFAGGVRETVARFMSAHAIDHRLRVHLQDENGRFPGTPDIEGTFRISFGKVPARSGERFNRYVASELIDVTGDFDADGIHDAVVHRDEHCIRVFRGTRKGFSSKSLMAAQTQDHWRFAVDDVDGDGRSDLVFRWMDPASTDAYEQCRVFLTREKTQ